MSGIRLSPQAKRDLLNIAGYGSKKFGAKTAQTYVRGVHDLLSTLAANPRLGVELKSGRRHRHRHPYRQHVIFYEVEPAGIFVLRIYPMARLLNADDQPD